MQTIRRLNVSLALLALMLTAGCAKNVPPNLTPEGTAAFQKTRVIKALDIFRDFAIDAEAQSPKVISTDVTRKVVTYHQSALRVIQSTDAGWAAAVKTSLDEVLNTFPAPEREKFAPYVALVKAILEEIL